MFTLDEILAVQLGSLNVLQFTDALSSSVKHDYFQGFTLPAHTSGHQFWGLCVQYVCNLHSHHDQWSLIITHSQFNFIDPPFIIHI